MAAVTDSIGTNGRTHATITLFEASLSAHSGDTVRGECYDDSDFGSDDNMDFNDNTPTSVTLTVADGHRHKGTANTGVRVLCTASFNWTITIDWMILEWIEIDCNGKGSSTNALALNPDTNASAPTIRHCIVHDLVDTSNIIVMRASESGRFLNNIIYHITSSGGYIYGILGASTSTDEFSVYGNTIDRLICNSGDGADWCYGIFVDDDNAAKNAQNNAVTRVDTGSGAGPTACYVDAGTSGSTISNNLDDDGTGSVTGAATDQYLNVGDGTENYHLKLGSDCLGAGVDLVATPAGVETDIDGTDRDAAGFTWDIGADQHTEKYWVGDTDTDWNDTDNWASFSGQAGGAGVPTDYEDAIFDDGYSTQDCTCDVAFSVGTLTVLGTYDGKLDFADSAYGHASAGDMTFDGSGTVDCGDATITCSGNFDNEHQTTWTSGTSEVVLDGTAREIRSADTRSCWDVTVPGSCTLVSGDRLYLENTLSVTGTLTITGSRVRVRSGSLTGNGTIDGVGNLMWYQGCNGSAFTGTIACGTFTAERTCSIGPCTISATVTCDVAAGSGQSLTLDDSTFTGSVTFKTDPGDGAYTIANNTNDPNLIFQNDVTVTDGASSLTWTTGAGTITLSGANNQSIDFNGEAVEDIVINKSAGDVTWTGAVTTDSFTGTSTGTGDFDPNGQTITTTGNCDWAAAFTFEAGSDTMDGSDWQIGGNFTADGQTLPADSGWDLDVTGTAVASGAGDVSFSTAGGTAITATGWNDGGNNSGWNFGAAGNAMPMAIHHYQMAGAL